MAYGFTCFVKEPVFVFRPAKGGSHAEVTSWARLEPFCFFPAISWVIGNEGAVKDDLHMLVWEQSRLLLDPLPNTAVQMIIA